MITMVKKVAICRPFLVILVAITVCTHDLIFQYFIFSCNFIEKETLAQVLSCEFYEISKNTFLTEHLWTIVSEWFVTILTHGRTYPLLNSLQKFVEIQGWLLLTFFICLHNQLGSFNSIILQMSEKRDSSNRQ